MLLILVWQLHIIRPINAVNCLAFIICLVSISITMSCVKFLTTSHAKYDHLDAPTTSFLGDVKNFGYNGEKKHSLDTIKLSKLQNKNKKKKNTRKAQTSSWNFVQRLYFLPPLEIFWELMEIVLGLIKPFHFSV